MPEISEETMRRLEIPRSDAAVGHRITRRQALVAGSSSVLGAVALGACGSGKGTPTTGTTEQQTPKRGGTLRLGMITGGRAGELIIPSEISIPNCVRTTLLYDPLFQQARDLHALTPMLALRAEASDNARVWTFTLRPGVQWHNGQDFTSADVVHTIRSWGAADSQTFGKFNGTIDYNGVRARGKLTVEVPLVQPMGDFPSLLTYYSQYIVPAGSTAKSLARDPVGTGPFKFGSFEPGTQSTFSRNPNYWQHGKPLVDTVIVNSSFTDETARLNAFQAGDVDILPLLPPLEAKQISSSPSSKLLRVASPAASPIYMNVKRPPFSDVRVRQALRLLVDRQAMVDNALAGFGTVGNDLFGRGAKFFASDLVRERDVEQAKAILRAAGQADLKVTLETSVAATGLTQAAALFAEQAAAGGVTVTVQTVSPSTYFTPPKYPETFAQDAMNNQASISGWYYYTFKQYNDTGWGFDKAMAAAAGAYPPSEQLWRDVQETQFNEGGYIVWGQQDNLDAVAAKVNGMTASPVSYAPSFDLNDAWLAD